MAGKKGMKGGGGKRAGAGRKPGSTASKLQPRDISAALKKQITQDAEDLAKEYGESLNKAMIRLCFLDETPPHVKSAIWNTYLGTMTVKESEQKIDVSTKREGPAVYLPEKKPDVALEVIEGGSGKGKGT